MVWKRVAPWAMILVSALAFAASGCGSSMKDGTDSSGETESAAPENTDAGEGYQLPRIYFQLEEQQGFEEHALLTEYLMKNSYTDSIETIMSVKEEYWDYLDSLNGHRSVDEQLQVIAENRSRWCPDLEYAGELCQYAVADLDRNGRYEVIVSDMAGTGLYTYSRFFEINDSYDSPDMSVSCKDADGNAISEEEYKSAADNYFSGWQKSEIHLGWQDVSGLADDTEGAAAQLEQSLNVYSSHLGESG